MRNQLVKNALAIWAECIDVNTLDGRKRITQFFTENRPSRGASYWKSHLEKEVSTNGVFDDSKRRGDRGQYCGLFIAYAGLGLIQPDIGYYCLPSTARMNSLSKWREAGAVKPSAVAAADIQPGDIVTVETGRGKHYGDHFAIVLARDGGVLETVEGNANGILGNGKRGRGVVKNTRDISKVRMVYRLDDRHFVGVASC